ncbi:MAG: 3-dehydroquinate synthase [Endomicrobia bacterium]|nr:3-dehydroquinate synthase [Endomicrobiia bacterium]MCL2799271.1 3-dehydroquinate synthase [Endomicrobiia bacterium]
MPRFKIRLKQNPYNILISGNAEEFFKSLKKIISGKNLFVVTDLNVAKLHLKRFFSLLRAKGFNVKTAVIKAGERGKSLKSLSFLYDKALRDGIDRKSCVIAFGGGVVGDIAGFFASTYMRGIRYVQVPTTLLAMSDSSVGGKTAVNTSGGKNIAGTFYQPSFVWINSRFLATLEQRHIKNGIAEIIKYAFIFDKNFYDYINGLFEKGFITSRDFDYMVYKSCRYKADIVEKDEKETKGLREVLNFGHTFAHALETYTGYKRFLHGEAVAAGMLFAARLSASLKLCRKEVYTRVLKLLETAGFVFDVKGLNAAKLLELMKKDKKSINGKIKFVLLKDIGKTATGYYVKDSKVKQELEKLTKAGFKSSLLSSPKFVIGDPS